MTPNQTLETNCRPASPLEARQQVGRAGHARPCVFGGSRSALRWATVVTTRMKFKTPIGFALAIAALLFVAGCSTSSKGHRESSDLSVSSPADIESRLNDRNTWRDWGDGGLYQLF